MDAALSAIPGLLFLTLGYIALCAVSPFGNCRKCRGFGFDIKRTRRGHLKPGRPCRRCHGDRKRIRVGRWLFNRATRLHHDGAR